MCVAMFEVLKDSAEPIRYAVYARQSAEHWREQPMSELRTAIRRQHPQGREIAVYHDRCLGSAAERSGLAQLLDDLDNGRVLIDELSIEDWTRLGRTVAEQRRCRRLGAEHRFTIVAIVEGRGQGNHRTSWAPDA